MSIAHTTPPSVGSSRRRNTIRFHARDVTGTHEINVDGIPRGTPSGVVAQTLAARMELPTHVPWSLRNDRTGTWLKDDQALDEQVGDTVEARLTLTPKTHLGGAIR